MIDVCPKPITNISNDKSGSVPEMGYHHQARNLDRCRQNSSAYTYILVFEQFCSPHN